jgi:hypothetical protein
MNRHNSEGFQAVLDLQYLLYAIGDVAKGPAVLAWLTQYLRLRNPALIRVSAKLRKLRSIEMRDSRTLR